MSVFIPKYPIIQPEPETKVCGCGKGYKSDYDGLCKFCREGLVRRAQAKSVGVRHRGDGLTVKAYRVIIGELNRKDVYL